MPTQGTPPALDCNAGCACATALSKSGGVHNAAAAIMLTASRFDLLTMSSPSAFILTSQSGRKVNDMDATSRRDSSDGYRSDAKEIRGCDRTGQSAWKALLIRGS